jgi:hypothetical protein
LLGGNAVGDRDLIEPAAAGFAGRAVEPGDVRLEIDDRRAIDEVHAGEPDDRAGYVQDLDEAEPDGVDPLRPPRGEYALRALLASQQERDVPQRRLLARLGQPVQPRQQPGVVELGEAVQALLVAVGDLDGPMLGAVESRLDRRGFELGVAGVDYPDHRQGNVEVHAVMVPETGYSAVGERVGLESG